ncbi:MAG: aldolase [Dehalococcoidales bacterium]|jgi:L-fuculose-phosphate aldolase
MLLSQFQGVGRDLFNLGLVTSSSGNLSVRMGERIIITRRGSALSCLEEPDLIETGLDKNDRATPLASTELAVHRAIYQTTRASAIVHAHSPYATALSLAVCEIIPSDTEGITTLGTVPVVGRGQEVKPGALAKEISQALDEYSIVMVAGHGSFAIGQLLEEALSYTTIMEASARINCLLRSLQAGPSSQI